MVQDRELLRRIAADESAAFADLFRRYQPRLLRFVARLGHAPAQAEEIADDTLVVVWRHAARLREDSRASSWIFAIAQRIASKQGSALLRDRLRFGEDTEACADTGDGPEACCERGQAQARLQRALARLPPSQREAVALTYLGECSCREAARRLHCPVGTVKSRLSLARAHLRGDPEFAPR